MLELSLSKSVQKGNHMVKIFLKKYLSIDFFISFVIIIIKKDATYHYKILFFQKYNKFHADIFFSFFSRMGGELHIFPYYISKLIKSKLM